VAPNGNLIITLFFFIAAVIVHFVYLLFLFICSALLLSLKIKFRFLHRLLHRLDNVVLKKCFVLYSQSVEFVSMCYDFDVMIDICTEQDINHKIFEHFSCVVKVTSF